MRSSFELRIIDGRHSLDHISQEWTNLTNRLEKKRFYHLIEYYKAYIDALEKNPESIYFCILFNEGNVIGIFPLRKVIWSIGPISIRVLESVQHTNPQIVDFQYDFIMESKEEPGLIFQALLDNLENHPEMQWDLLSIRNIFEDSYATRALEDINYMKKQCNFSKYCYYIATDSYDNIIMNTSQNFRRSLKRSKKKLLDIGEFSFISINDLSGLEEAYIRFLKLEGSGWKQKQGTAIIQHEDARNFYLNLIRLFSDKYYSEIHELRVEDKTIASFLSIKDDIASYLPKICYDENLEKVSPGKQLFDYFIKRCCDADKNNELILLSNASHLNHWRPQRFKMLNYYLFNNSFQGYIVYISKKVLDAIEPYYPYLLPYYKLIKAKQIKKMIYVLR